MGELGIAKKKKKLHDWGEEKKITLTILSPKCNTKQFLANLFFFF